MATTDCDSYCGTGSGNFPQPGDPDLNNSILNAVPAFGGVDVFWEYPGTNPEALSHTIVFRSTNEDPDTMIRHRVVTGDYLYDKDNPGTDVKYYYWIQRVSVNGTYGDVIGPASATARPTIDQTLEMLTGRIDSGTLGQKLKEDLQGIDTNRSSILAEEQKRLRAVEDLSFDVDQTIAQSEDIMAALQQEIIARTDEDTALAEQTNRLYAEAGEHTAQVEQSFQAFADTVDGDLKDIGANFSMQLGADGLIGGFGINNDGSMVEAGFDVDRFWVGRTGENKRKPFIIENDETFIDEAVIKSLTFEKLQSEEGDLIVNNGKILASYLDAKDLTVEQAQSRNYIKGQQGWQFNKDGTFEQNSTTYDGRVIQNGDGIKVYDDQNRLRVKIGKLS